MKNDCLKYGVTAQGRKELKKHLEAKKLTHKEAGLGRCYFCMNGYSDGKVSCKSEVCPLFQYMPYKNKGWE